MRVKFETTLDEMVDVQRRAAYGLETTRRWRRQRRWRSVLYSGCFPALAVFALIPDKEPATRLIWASVLAACAMIVTFLSYKNAEERRWRQALREQLGSEGPATIEVELSPEGVRTKQHATQILFEWPGVETIDETDDSVDIYTQHGGLVVVRRRAFESPEMKKQFVETARRYRDEAKGSHT